MTTNAAVEQRPIRNVGLYIRYSTEEQKAKSFSEEMQTEQCLQRFEAVYGKIPHNLRVFKDLGKSGAIGLDNPAFGGKEHREGLEALLNAMADGELDLVLCYSQDRLARDEFLWHYMNATIFQKHRIPILFAREGHDLLTEEGQMIGTLHALAASLERRKASRNVVASCQRRASEGYLTLPPYGWEFDPTQVPGPRVRRRIVCNEAEGAILLESFSRYTSGWPTAEMVRDLNGRRILSPSGGHNWTTDGLLKVLANPVHAGLVRHKNRLYPGQHAPLRYWSPEQRDLLLLRIEERRDHPLKIKAVEDYLLAGILFCKHCGRRLVANRSWRRNVQQYSCHSPQTEGQHRRRGKDGKLGDVRSCPGISRRADELEAAIIQAVRDLANSPAVQKMAQDRLQAAMDEKDTRLQDELAGVTKEVARVQQGFTRLFAMLDEDKIQPDEFEAENDRRRAEQEALENRRARLEAEIAQRRSRLAELTAALELLRDFDRLWDKMTMGERKELLRRIDPHMTIRREDDLHIVTIRPGWTEPIEITFVCRPRTKSWTPGPDAPLTRAQISLLWCWREGMALDEIAQARHIALTTVWWMRDQIYKRLLVKDLDEAVELVKGRLDRCRKTVKTEGRFNRRPAQNPTVLSEPLMAVLRLMAEDNSGNEIAAALKKDKSTVSRQMTAICNRLAVHSRDEAVARARELGLI
ncbi:MAG: recombinase family protein [Armatimonadia bacterium]